MQQLIELDIKTRRRAFDELNAMERPKPTPSDDPAV